VCFQKTEDHLGGHTAIFLSLPGGGEKNLGQRKWNKFHPVDNSDVEGINQKKRRRKTQTIGIRMENAPRKVGVKRRS